MVFRTVPVLTRLLILGSIAFEACARSGEVSDMHFIVPAGYHGVIVIRAIRGAPLLPLDHNCYTITFPKNGVLDVASTKVFYEWHHTSAVFDDGAPLKVAVVPTEATPTKSPTVELYDLGADSDGLVYWFVGTHDEFAPMQGKNFRNYLTSEQNAILWPSSTTK